MISRRVVLLAVAVLAICAIAVQGHIQREHKVVNDPTFFADPHPLTTKENIDAKWSKINADLKARNYKVNASEYADDGGVYGVDLSSWAGEDTFTCFIQNGYTYAIVRQYQSNCQVDPNGVHTVANAWAAGVAHVDIYLFPSFDCGTSAAGQVDAAISGMGSIPFGTLWLDIEAQGSGWSSDTSQNNAWLQEAINEATAQLGASRVGIYSSAYGWSVAMGDWTGGGDLALWYAHYDSNPSFSDWSPFAGFSSPSMKQYAGDASICSFDVDLNWYPA